MENEKVLENLKKVAKNQDKLTVKCLKYLKKIKTSDQYDDYLTDNINIPIIEWFIQVILIRPFIFFVAFWCLSAIGVSLIHPQQILLIAVGTSLSWYLLVELKQDLWRK